MALENRVNHKRVARVMRAHGIVGYRRRRRVVTTIPEPADRIVPDLVERDLTAPATNRVYVGDITYLPIADGSNLYLATVIDCYSRRLTGGGRWPIICAPISLPMPCKRHNRREGRCRERSFTPITARSTPARPTPTCALNSA